MDQNEFARAFSGILQELIDRGWGAPIYFASLSTNGFGQIGNYDIDAESKQWAFSNLLSCNPADEEGVRLPVNIMLVNTEGDAVRVVLTSKKGKLEYRFSEN